MSDADAGDQPGGSTPSRDRHRGPKLAEELARAIATLIVDRDLPEGSRLPPERQMVESFGVGRTTLREALRLLETRGVITIRSGPRGGPVVRRPRPSDLGEALTLILQFESASLVDVLEARRAFEPTLTRLAASRIDRETLRDLRGAIDAAVATDTEEQFMRETHRFHTIIAGAAGNAALHLFHETLQSVASAFVDPAAVHSLERRRANISMHERILAALTAGDEDAAAAAMEDHLSEGARDFHRLATDTTQPVRWTQ